MMGPIMGVSNKYNSEMWSSACVLIREHRSSITIINHAGLETNTHDDNDMIMVSDANHNVIMA